MHILLLPSWYASSSIDVTGVFFRDQAVALKSLGHDVGVIAPVARSVRGLFKNKTKGKMNFYESDNGVHTYRKEFLALLPRIPYGNYMLFKRVARKLFFEYIKRHGCPDVIHAHSVIFGGAAAVQLGEEIGVPVVITEHSSGFALNLYSEWQYRLAQKSYIKSSSCIAVSPALASQLSRRMPETKGKWKWIPNVVANRFSLVGDNSKTHPPIVFLNLALMTEIKGQRDLVHAFHQSKRAGLEAELWLAGDGPIKTSLENEVRALGLEDSVRFLGLIQPHEVPELLKKVNVMVLSSHYETFGVVAAEALMAGLPVIATRCGGPECIVTPEDGLLVPVNDPSKLSVALQLLASTLDQYDSVSISSRAKKRFSGRSIAEEITVEYGRVMSGSGSCRSDL